MGVPPVRAAMQAARDSSAGYLPSGACRFPGSGTGGPKRSDSPGASCGTRSHRLLARFRFGDGSQHTDGGQVGSSHQRARSPVTCQQTVRGVDTIAVWFAEQTASIASAKTVITWKSDWPALLIKDLL